MMEHIPEALETIQEENNHPSSEMIPSASQKSKHSSSTKPPWDNLPNEVTLLILEHLDKPGDVHNFCLTTKANHQKFIYFLFRHYVRFGECRALPIAVGRNMMNLAKNILKVPRMEEFAPKRTWYESLRLAEEKNYLHFAELLFEVKAVQDCLRNAAEIGSKRVEKNPKDGALLTEDEELFLRPMFKAAKNGRLEFLRLYLRYFNVHVQDDWGSRVLQTAASRGQLDVVKALVEKYYADTNIRHHDNKELSFFRPIELAAWGKHWDVVEWFLSKGLDHCFDGSRVSIPCLFAAENGQASLVKRLLQDGFNPNEWHRVLWYIGTPLERAVDRGHDEIVRLLLEDSRVDPNTRDFRGQTPLMYAAGSHQPLRDKVLCRLLEDKRVDTNAQDDYGYNALTWAARCSEDQTTKILLDSRKVEPNHRDLHGRTPVFHAASRNYRVLKLFVEDVRVDLNIADQDGKTPLHEAASHDKTPHVELLLKSGRVDTDQEEFKFHRTPMMCACDNANYNMAKLLLEAGGVDINKRDTRKGWTPLQHAIYKCNRCDGSVADAVRIAEMLLSTGRVLHEVGDCQEILEFAVKYRSENIVKMMLQTGQVRVTPATLELCHKASIKTLLISALDP